MIQLPRVQHLFSPQSIDHHLSRDGRTVHFTSALSDETEAFEEELCRRTVAPESEHDESSAARVEAEPLDLPLQQRHVWLRQLRGEFRLLQVRGADGAPAMQAAVTVQRPRLLPFLGHGLVNRLGPATSGEEELWGLRMLRELCAGCGDLLTLRLQPRRTRLRALWGFEERARLAGFALCEPEGVTHTLMVDLRPDPEAILGGMSPKQRQKIRGRRKHEEDIEVRVVTDPALADECQRALAASLGRTGAGARRLDWDTMFAVARARPDLLRIMGLFFKGRTNGGGGGGKLMAFASAFRHGAVAEYVSGGSLSDPELRKLGFNYWLLWDLFLWARESGASWFDLGGVTMGGPSDPLAGISGFKRHLASLEVEVGREMMIALHPGRHLCYETLRALRDRSRQSR